MKRCVGGTQMNVDAAGTLQQGVHGLRHDARKQMVRAGLSLNGAARHLGHSSIETPKPPLCGPTAASSGRWRGRKGRRCWD